MVKIYYTFDKRDTNEFIKSIFLKYYNIPNAEICKSKNGKPYIKNGIFFNAAHSGDVLAVAVSDKEVGLDCELKNKKMRTAVLKRFSEKERGEIKTDEDFILHWTAKESFIKFLGGTLAHDLKNVEFINGEIFYLGKKQPIFLLRTEISNYTIACVSEYTQMQLIKI